MSVEDASGKIIAGRPGSGFEFGDPLLQSVPGFPIAARSLGYGPRRLKSPFGGLPARLGRGVARLDQDAVEDAEAPETAQFEGQDVLKVAPEALTLVAREALRDVSFLYRPGHLAQLAAILDDPEASENDRGVALALLRNADYKRPTRTWAGRSNWPFMQYPDWTSSTTMPSLPGSLTLAVPMACCMLGSNG